MGYLGVELPATDRVYHCLERDQENGKVCLEWMHRARLYLSYKEEKSKEKDQGFRCYTLTWESLSSDSRLVDCFENGQYHGHWYVFAKLNSRNCIISVKAYNEYSKIFKNNLGT